MDLYLLLAPVLLLPVIWLLRFAGCTTFGTSTSGASPGSIVKRINCGGPFVAHDVSKGETLDWEADTATVGTAGFGQVGRPKVTDDAGNSAGDVYETWRVGPSGGLPYELTLPEGDYKVTLKFARLDSNVNIGGRFLVQFQNAAPIAIDAAESVHPLSRKFDHPDEAVHVDTSGKLKITFLEDQQVGGGTFPFINAIEVTKATDVGK